MDKNPLVTQQVGWLGNSLASEGLLVTELNLVLTQHLRSCEYRSIHHLSLILDHDIPVTHGFLTLERLDHFLDSLDLLSRVDTSLC